jgi:hypothetical protein
MTMLYGKRGDTEKRPTSRTTAKVNVLELL